jgi:hypothetical protein
VGLGSAADRQASTVAGQEEDAPARSGRLTTRTSSQRWPPWLAERPTRSARWRAERSVLPRSTVCEATRATLASMER